MNVLRYIFDSTHRTITGLVVIGFLAVAGLASVLAAPITSYTVHNNPDMFLNEGITASLASFDIAAPVRNGATVTFPTLSGAILKISYGSREELVYYSSGSVNATTKVITLYEVVRDVCWNAATSFATCGSGKIFPKGSSVRMVDAAQLLNLKANIDRANTFTALQSFGSGVIITGSGYTLGPPRLTTAERDALTGLRGGEIIYNKTTSLINQYVGGAWSAVGTDATPNASDTVAGKVQDGTLADLRNRTMTGSTGAFNALSFRWIVKNGSGSETSGYVLQAGSNGALSPSLGGTGLSSPTASGVLIGNGEKNSMLQVTGSSGQYLRANTKGSWYAATPTSSLDAWYQPKEKLVTSNGVQNFTTNYTIPANYATGSMVIIEATGTGSSGGAFFRYGLKLGTTEICAANQLDAGAPRAPWKLRGELQIVRNGSAGAVATTCVINGSTAMTTSGSVVSMDTTTTNTVNLFLRSNGTNSYSYLMNFFVNTFLR